MTQPHCRVLASFLLRSAFPDFSLLVPQGPCAFLITLHFPRP